MIYLVISFTLLAVLGYVFWNPKFKGFRAKNEMFLTFVLTFSATFVGVFLALYFADLDSVSEEKERTVELLYVSSQDIYDNTQALVVLFSGFVGDTESNDYDYYEYLQRNPRSLPETYFLIFENDTFLRTISVDAFGELSSSRRTMIKLVGLMNSEKVEDELMKSYIDIYGRELLYSQQVMITEIAYLEGHLNLDQAKNLRDGYKLEKIGVTLDDIEAALTATETPLPVLNNGN